ncbi:hypothetical protein THRCLA_06262 [Thraustotheca clavata]|uniref:Tim44-like domain-containing protein n=1 Tax=Thraustotheca clavata TaxID=74557 RepID=A0A1V9ZPW8_9STRA|nr:hypothetical protein THRCLA_06262 [Thraustotheca clavata]
MHTSMRRFSSLPVAPAASLLRSVILNAKSLVHFHRVSPAIDPSLSALRKWSVCTNLQMLREPIETNDFLEGAATAVDRVLHAVHSDDFRAFVGEKNKENDVVSWLQEVMTQKRFDACVFEMEEACKRGVKYDLRHVHFENLGLFEASVILDKIRLQVHCDMVHTVRVTSGHRDFQVPKSSSMLWTFESSTKKRDWKIVDFQDISLLDH